MSSSPRDAALLLDINASGVRIEQYLKGVSRGEFLSDFELQDAVVWRLTVIGEAARMLSEATRATVPEVPWASVIGMRNVLIHQYGDIEMERVWETARQALPQLLTAIEPLLPSQE